MTHNLMPLRQAHLDALVSAVRELERELGRIERWGRHLARVLHGGGRLLAAGNGGSAAEAQHLTAELVGRYRDERIPLSAISLHAESSSLTAIVNDYGPEAAFARQVAAHGRSGDVLVVLSTSGRSENVLAAAREAKGRALTAWALTGPRPNPLDSICDESLSVNAEACATIQELHLVIVHLLCEAVDHALRDGCIEGSADSDGDVVRPPSRWSEGRP